MKISKTISLIVRSLEILWAVCIMGLIGNMISTSGWNQIPRQGGNAAVVNYSMFVGVFTLLSLFYPIHATFIDLQGEIASAVALGIDALNLLFYMCGAIAMAAAMGVHSCSNLLYTYSNGVTNSSPDTVARCREAQAATAFLWIGFLTFIVSTFFSASKFLDRYNPDGTVRAESPPDEEAYSGPPMADYIPTNYGKRYSGGPAMANIEKDDSIHTEPREQHFPIGGPEITHDV